MTRVHFFRQILRFVAVAGVLIGSNVVETSWSQATKAKGKAAAKKSNDLEEELAKYVTSLIGEESPIAVGKKVTVALSSGKTLNDFEVTETLLGKEDETLKFLSVQDSDGKKKQKLASSAIARIRSGEHDYDVLLDPGK